MGDTLMTADDRAVCRHKIARSRHIFCLALNKSGIVIVRNKTDFLTVCLVGHLQADILRDLTDLVLGILAHRHKRMGKLLLGQIVQRIGLILCRSSRFL